MTWKDGETISPLGLNRIEEAVASMNESYTPTVWEVGDLITAEKLNKIEEGIANAPVPSGKKEITSTAEVNVANYATAQVVDEDLVAGNIKKDVDILGVVGSYEAPASDFSTAEVTINATFEGSPTIATKNFIVRIQYPAGVSISYNAIYEDFTGNILLYQNSASIALNDIYAEDSNGNLYEVSTVTPPTTSGGASFDSDNSVFNIIDDCTINVAMVQSQE